MDPFVFIQDFREHAPLPERGILSRTVHNDARAKVIQFLFAPGEGLSAHRAPMPAILYFAQGEAKVTLGGQDKAAREGTFVYMQPDLEHAIEASTEVVMLLLMIKNPS